MNLIDMITSPRVSDLNAEGRLAFRRAMTHVAEYLPRPTVSASPSAKPRRQRQPAPISRLGSTSRLPVAISSAFGNDSTAGTLNVTECLT